MKSILIAGYGVVGQNLHKELASLDVDVYDKFKPEVNTIRDIKYDFCFICVNTPYLESVYPEKDIYCDISQVKMVLQEVDASIYVVKSAILPGTIDELKQQFDKHIIVSPEYYGETPSSSRNNHCFNFTILGGDRDDCYKVQQLLQEVYDGSHVFRVVDAKLAETVKYMENSGIYLKVCFCLMFKELCDKLGIKYEDLRELWLLDERVSKSHTLTFEEHPYVESKCMNKDIPALANMFDLQLLKDAIKFNEWLKEKYKKGK